MDRKAAIDWVLWVCADHLRRSQAKTLSYLVAGALVCVRASLANIGRGVLGTTADKHKIKRVYRFLRNERVEVSDAMRGLVGVLLKRHRKAFKNRPLAVGFDWVKVRGFYTLMAAAVFKGRATPLLWGSYADKLQGKSQNALEEGLLGLLREMVPAHVELLILADRGFGRTELGRFCRALGIGYVIRICTKVWIATDHFSGKLKDYPVRKGDCKLLKAVEYRKSKPVTQNLVVRWKSGLPAKSDQPWYLMTSLGEKPAKISDLYARRFDIEELFRDAKSKRNGWSLRDIRVKTAERFDRLLLVLAIAYLLLAGLGLWCKSKYPPRRWCSNNRPHECSAFAALATAIAEVGNWG
jgi:hypothetical protein